MSATGLPVVITKAGLQPRTPAEIRAQLLAIVSATNPGYTADLPASLIEDIASTDVAAIALIDSARVEFVNSLTPFGANDFLVNQLGAIYGVEQGLGSNTSVYVQFSGTPGWPIAVGFTVSDGSHQYTVQDGGIVGAAGTTSPLFCLATVSGTWAVPAGSVTTLVTSVPSTVNLSVTNPQAGTPALGAQSTADYRSQVLQAGLAASQGMARFLKTKLGAVLGVQPRLVSVLQTTAGWEVIVGGGDPYEVAYAIYTGLFDISTLVGSTLTAASITKASNGVVTTDLNHGYSNGQIAVVSGALGMTQINGINLTVDVIDEKSFRTGVNTSGFGVYTANSGTVSPNLRNVVVSIQDYPDVYLIPFVNPPQQSVAVAVTWNTSSPNFVSETAVAQAGGPAVVNYINSIAVGVPINLFELQSVFQAAISTLIPPQLLTRMVFAVSINGIGTDPDAGTGIIAGDPESYFLTDATLVVISQG